MPFHLERELNQSSAVAINGSDILTNLNITKDFINLYLSLLKNRTTKQQYVGCDEYCNGSFRNIMNDYKEVHGYLSLVVSLSYLLNVYVFLE